MEHKTLRLSHNTHNLHASPIAPRPALCMVVKATSTPILASWFSPWCPPCVGRVLRGDDPFGFVLFVLNQLFITRYMQPGGLWQRLCRCPLRGNGGVLYKETFSDPEPACAVIVRYPCARAPHNPPYIRKEKR